MIVGEFLIVLRQKIIKRPSVSSQRHRQTTMTDRQIHRGRVKLGLWRGQEFWIEATSQLPTLSSSLYVLLANTADLTTHSRHLVCHWAHWRHVLTALVTHTHTKTPKYILGNTAIAQWLKHSENIVRVRSSIPTWLGFALKNALVVLVLWSSWIKAPLVVSKLLNVFCEQLLITCTSL